MMLWAHYRGEVGLAVDRLEQGIARAGFVTARAMGSKVKFKDLFPDFTASKRSRRAQFAATVASMPGTKVERLPMPKRKAVKCGQ